MANFKKNPIYVVRIKWYYALLCGFSSILDGIVMIVTLGHLGTDLQLRVSLLGARKSWCVVTPVESPVIPPVIPPIDYIGKTDRYHIDGDGDPLDDFGTGLGGMPMQKEKRYCKGCHADVTNTMYCGCGDFALLKSETLSEEEYKNFQ